MGNSVHNLRSRVAFASAVKGSRAAVAGGVGIPVYFADWRWSFTPLGLGAIIASARADAGLGRAFAFDEQIRAGVLPLLASRGANARGLVVFSDFMWNDAAHAKNSRAVKLLRPGLLTVHGGPAVPRDPAMLRAYMRERPWVDVAALGEGEESFVALLRRVAEAGPSLRALAQSAESNPDGLSGFAIRREAGGGEAVLTGPATMPTALDGLQSAYLSGVFDGVNRHRYLSATLETNRGCPYGCSFCDWGAATLQKLRLFSLERVEAELEWIGRHGIQMLWIADANFGILERDVAIAEMIVRTRMRFGYPREAYVNYAKNATERVSEICGILVRGKVATDAMIAFQTLDRETLKNVERANIHPQRYDALVSSLRRRNIAVTTDLMLGLPGQTPAKLLADFDYCFDRDVGLRAYQTSVWPNSPMAEAEYVRRFGVKVNERGYVVATNSFSEADAVTMARLHRMYLVLVNFGSVRHAMTVLRWDYGVAASRVVERLLRWYDEPSRGEFAVLRETLGRLFACFPRDYFDVRVFLRSSLLLVDWHAYVGEFLAFVEREFEIELTEGVRETLIEAQAAVMPRVGARLPLVRTLAHDLVGWMRAHYSRDLSGYGAVAPKRDARVALVAYGPGTIAVDDPVGVTRMPLEPLLMFNYRAGVLELRSPLLDIAGAPGYLTKSDDGLFRSARAAMAAGGELLWGFSSALDAKLAGVLAKQLERRVGSAIDAVA